MRKSITGSYISLGGESAEVDTGTGAVRVCVDGAEQKCTTPAYVQVAQ